MAEGENNLSREKKAIKEDTEIGGLEKDLNKLVISSENIVKDTNTTSDLSSDMICPICQDKKLHSITLPCSHTFCYLCIKGVYARQRQCPMCRHPIPVDAITNPPSDNELSEDETPKWMYQAKSGGWWFYEERVSEELERCYQSGSPESHVQISGFMYVVDFARMVQFRQEKPERVRDVRRGVGGDDKSLVRGVAGIPLSLPNRTGTGDGQAHLT